MYQETMPIKKDIPKRSSLYSGSTVEIVTKADQQSGKIVRGIVKDILTNTSFHPHGIKVRLIDGRVGRVRAIIMGPSEPEDKK
jgi:uncharacterized repeat protein (TIGR03833 family)